jgi:hypothetical protein
VGSFEAWAVPFLVSEIIAIPGLAFLGLPIFSALTFAAVSTIISKLAKSAEMNAMFMHTAIRKSQEARTYVAAIRAKAKLPDNATMEEVLNAEENEIDAFRTFVVVS